MAIVTEEVEDIKCKYPMHCIRYEDLPEFQFLPSHEEAKRMGKLIIPDEDDERDIIFVSHQWTGSESFVLFRFVVVGQIFCPRFVCSQLWI